MDKGDGKDNAQEEDPMIPQAHQNDYKHANAWMYAKTSIHAYKCMI
jgi:hypothetical protein